MFYLPPCVIVNNWHDSGYAISLWILQGNLSVSSTCSGAGYILGSLPKTWYLFSVVADNSCMPAWSFLRKNPVSERLLFRTYYDFIYYLLNTHSRSRTRELFGSYYSLISSTSPSWIYNVYRLLLSSTSHRIASQDSVVVDSGCIIVWW